MATEAAPANLENAEVDDVVDPKISKLVNAAVSTHLKRHTKAMGDQFGAMLDERFAAFKPAATVPTPVPSKDAAVDGDDATKRELEDLRNELKAQKQRASEKEVYADVRGLLQGKVRPEALDTALKLLKADGLIKIRKDGSAAFKSDQGEIDLAEGLSEWLSGEGVLFVPTQTPRRLPVKGPTRAPARVGETAQNLTPAQKVQADLARRGLVLDA